MKRIPLTRGKVALVDDCDYARVNRYKWQASPLYAYRTVRVGGKKTTVMMHRFILGLQPGDGIQTDHANRDGFDNRRANLRKATPSDNQGNRITRVGASPYKGVSWSSQYCSWRAAIHHQGRDYFLGRYETQWGAAMAYDTKARQLFGEFARTNFPPTTQN